MDADGRPPPQHRARLTAELANLIIHGATFMKLVRSLIGAVNQKVQACELLMTLPADKPAQRINGKPGLLGITKPPCTGVANAWQLCRLNVLLGWLNILKPDTHPGPGWFALLKATALLAPQMGMIDLALAPR